MPRMTKAERALAMDEALTMSAKGSTVQDIADHLGVAWNTASALVDDAIANNAEHRSADRDREKAIANYRAVIRAAWERFKRTDNRSHNATGYLNTIKAAQEAMDKLTGARAPVKYQDVTDEFEIVFDEDELDADSVHSEG